MSVYLFSTRVLLEASREDAGDSDSDRDFGRNVLPSLVGRRRSSTCMIASGPFTRLPPTILRRDSRIGYDLEADRRAGHFVTDSGIVVVRGDAAVSSVTDQETASGFRVLASGA